MGWPIINQQLCRPESEYPAWCGYGSCHAGCGRTIVSIGSLKGPLARYGLGTQLPFNLRGLVAGDVAFLLGKMELRDPIDSNGESLLMVKNYLH
jgi:hypothetical protein